MGVRYLTLSTFPGWSMCGMLALPAGHWICSKNTAVLTSSWCVVTMCGWKGDHVPSWECWQPVSTNERHYLSVYRQRSQHSPPTVHHHVTISTFRFNLGTAKSLKKSPKRNLYHPLKQNFLHVRIRCPKHHTTNITTTNPSFNCSFPGEPGWASSPSTPPPPPVPEENLWGLMVRVFRKDVLSVMQNQYQSSEGNIKHWPQPEPQLAWPQVISSSTNGFLT